MKYNKDIINNAVMKSYNLSDVVRMLGINPNKGNRDMIKKYIEEYDINTSHFKYIKKNIIRSKPKKLEDILKENINFNTSRLKNKLYDAGLKLRECELCGQNEEWNGKKMSLILDHINGVNTDNRIENLRIVCPNCNATLDTHCSKNISKYRLYLKIENNKCIDCDKEIFRGAKRCIECNSIYKRITERPNYDILKEEVDNFGFCATARKYNVSDNTIRKWLKKYESNASVA